MKYNHSPSFKTILTVFFLCFFISCLSVSAADPSEFHWKRGTDSFALQLKDQNVWQFNYPVKPGAKPYFHPIALPGGSSLTWLSPPDHIWHLALWFSWKYINKVNYWEVNKEGICDGLTEWSDVRVETRSDHSARIRINLSYRPQKTKSTLLKEKRTIRISSPATDGSYFMDWTMEFLAGKENLKFDRTPSTEKSISGYAGLSARFAKELTDIQIMATADKGRMLENRYGYPATATDFNGRIDNGEAGMAMLNHPLNPRHPTRWYVITDPERPFWYMNAALLQSEAYDLAAGKKMTLRYRIWVHPQRWTSTKLNEEFERYRKIR
jgi:hypothetical protein